MAGLEALAVGEAGDCLVDREQFEKPARGGGHERLERIGDDAQSLEQGGDDLGHAAHLFGLPRERERRGCYDVLIGGIERLPYDFERAVEAEFIGVRRNLLVDSRKHLSERLILVVRTGSGFYLTREVTLR